jgi:hypothetical protein
VPEELGMAPRQTSAAGGPRPRAGRALAALLALLRRAARARFLL